MRAEYKCTKCGKINRGPEKWEDGVEYVCHSCSGKLVMLQQNSITTIAVCILGGSYLGLAAGPAGAIIGGAIGAVIGGYAGRHG